MISPLSERVSRVIILLALAVFGIVPLLSLLSTALTPQGSLPPGLAWPTDPQWQNFADAWSAANFLALLESSCLIVLGVVPISLAIASLAGYALAQFRVPGGPTIYILFLIGLTLPAESLITPLYYDLKSLGLLGSQLAVILPEIALLMPFGVFWMRAHFTNTETALTEAATIDGASRWQTFTRINLPLATPAWSALAILYFLATWNQYLLPLVLISDPSKRTMAGGLGAFQGQYGDNIQLLCAGSLIIITPSLIVFLVFQRSFVRALLAGAVK
ncbi:MAG TPA: carbohydrate ABC transporter permease [Galbitalea sp.]|jgi:raffinose/stachyose/melibiose transport system permease protein|nr:carbohydrate ABC transporter permease [Galbitalea sp.]